MPYCGEALRVQIPEPTFGDFDAVRSGVRPQFLDFTKLACDPDREPSLRLWAGVVVLQSMFVLQVAGHLLTLTPLVPGMDPGKVAGGRGVGKAKARRIEAPLVSQLPCPPIRSCGGISER